VHAFIVRSKRSDPQLAWRASMRTMPVKENSTGSVDRHFLEFLRLKNSHLECSITMRVIKNRGVGESGLEGTRPNRRHFAPLKSATCGPRMIRSNQPDSNTMHFKGYLTQFGFRLSHAQMRWHAKELLYDRPDDLDRRYRDHECLEIFAIVNMDHSADSGALSSAPLFGMPWCQHIHAIYCALVLNRQILRE
jgi:hypothetical protein